MKLGYGLLKIIYITIGLRSKAPIAFLDPDTCLFYCFNKTKERVSKIPLLSRSTRVIV